MHRIGSSERPDLALAVVIGAGGMGMAAARRLAQSWRLLLVDIDGARVEAAAATLRAEGCDAIGTACDITSPDAVAALAETVAARGPLRALAHVAGLSPSMADFRTIFRVNLLGAARVEQALLPLAGPGTAAIFISSMAGHMISPDADMQALLTDPLGAGSAERVAAGLGEGATPTAAYMHSKWGLMAMCRRRSFAWGERGARILSLSPGLIATPMGALEFAKPNTSKHGLLAKTPLQREGTMIEIADAIDYLASDRASFITGIDLLVDGGVTAMVRG